MPSTPPDKSSHLWDRVLDILRTQINPQTFNTWFTPIVFDSCDDATCALTVPNTPFQDYLLHKGAALLLPVIAEVFGAPRQLSISIRRTESTSSPDPGPTPFDVLPACRLNAAAPQDQWLIENVWMTHAVGILGGPPRAYKSWLALDMAVSVASGTPCLGTFPVLRPGPVLLYAAEDSASSLRCRLESITRARHIAFDHLDVRVITADRLRLDQLDDQQRFQATVALHQPQVVILDPLVRIHGADENASNAVAALLGYFRSLQRSTGAGILLIHLSRVVQYASVAQADRWANSPDPSSTSCLARQTAAESEQTARHIIRATTMSGTRVAAASVPREQHGPLRDPRSSKTPRGPAASSSCLLSYIDW